MDTQVSQSLFPHSADPAEVLNHWFADGLQSGWPTTNLQSQWFGGGPELDAEITRRFGPLVEAAQNGQLKPWENNPLAKLALVIVLDQYARNVYRGQPKAFAGDGRAQKLVLQALALGSDETLPTVGRVFFYMPLMHAESEALQLESLNRFTRLHATAPPELKDKLAGNLKAAQEHLDIIERFGRFPHRNAALGRTSTSEELEFLQTGPRFGQ